MRLDQAARPLFGGQNGQMTMMETYPSANPRHRRADVVTHALGLTLILVAGGCLLARAIGVLDPAMIAALFVYLACALASNLASWCYHFAPWHDRRVLLRRIDHAAIYPSITGTFTPFFIQANTTWTLCLLVLCWALTLVAIWIKITHSQVKTRWSTASYLGLGAIGLLAMPDLTDVPPQTLWFILTGSACYVIGTVFYARKSLPYRYSIWHVWVNLGGLFMLLGVWTAVF